MDKVLEAGVQYGDVKMDSKYLSLVNDFAKGAKGYCDLVDEYKLKTRSEFIYYAFLYITDLCNMAIQLPRISEVQDIDISRDKNTDPKFDQMKVLCEFLGDWVYSRQVFDGTAPEGDRQGDVVTADLADDLTDIYRNLRDGLKYFDEGDPDEAVWQWKFSFGIHWGRHATSALRAIYCRLAKGEMEL